MMVNYCYHFLEVSKVNQIDVDYKKSYDSDDIDSVKTVVVKIRVSSEEKRYIKMLAKLNQGDNVSSFIRKLIFEVYEYDITHKTEFIIKSILPNKPYPFNTIRDEFIYIRLTPTEKKKIESYAKMHHRDVSEFVRWITLHIYVSDYIKEN